MRTTITVGPGDLDLRFDPHDDNTVEIEATMRDTEGQQFKIGVNLNHLASIILRSPKWRRSSARNIHLMQNSIRASRLPKEEGT